MTVTAIASARLLLPVLAAAGSHASVPAARAAELTLEPATWALLSVPGEADRRSVRELFADDLPAGRYGEAWTVFAWDGEAGAYRRPGLDETLGTGAGFWMMQALGGSRTVEVAADAPAGAPAGAPEPGCASAACARLPLATAPDVGGSGGWTLAGFPSPDGGRGAELRVVAAGTACASGCDLDAAAAAGLSAANGWAWDGGTGTYRAVGTDADVPAWRGFWLGTSPSAAAAAPALLVPAGVRVPPGGDADAFNASLGRGLNLGHALEAPFEGAWGVTLEASDFDAIARAGFDSVRVPVRWSGYASDAPPYAIDETILARVDWVLDQAARTGLAAIVNVHLYDELSADPDAERDRFLAIWEQLGARYASRPGSVAFELLNEPNAAFDDDPGAWNALARDALAVVRRTNPVRPVLIGPVGFNVLERLDELELPDDPNLVATVHYYAPFGFTHQGATWVDPVPPVGVGWAPDDTGVGRAFWNGSWDTEVTGEAGTLRLRFGRRYAGFSLQHRAGGYLPTLYRLTVSGRVRADVICRGDGGFVGVDRLDASGAGPTSVELDLSACGPDTVDVALQNLLVDAPAFTIERGEVCDATGCEDVVMTAGQIVDKDLGAAAAWAAREGVPLNLGEFGVHAPADTASRAAWTARVQAAARGVGASTHYWNYSSDNFGARDQVTGSWRAPLLEALLP